MSTTTNTKDGAGAVDKKIEKETPVAPSKNSSADELARLSEEAAPADFKTEGAE